MAIYQLLFMIGSDIMASDVNGGLAHAWLTLIK